MNAEAREDRIDIAAGTLMEMLQWDPENAKKRDQVKRYLRDFVLEGL